MSLSLGILPQCLTYIDVHCSRNWTVSGQAYARLNFLIVAWIPWVLCGLMGSYVVLESSRAHSRPSKMPWLIDDVEDFRWGMKQDPISLLLRHLYNRSTIWKWIPAQMRRFQFLWLSCLLGTCKPDAGVWTSENLASAFGPHCTSLRNLGPVNTFLRSQSPSLWNREDTTYSQATLRVKCSTVLGT